MERIQTVEIEDPVYEETYTAHIQKMGTGGLDGYQRFPK